MKTDELRNKVLLAEWNDALAMSNLPLTAKEIPKALVVEFMNKKNPGKANNVFVSKGNSNDDKMITMEEFMQAKVINENLNADMLESWDRLLDKYSLSSGAEYIANDMIIKNEKNSAKEVKLADTNKDG